MSTFIKPPLPDLSDVTDLDGLMQARDAELLRAVADFCRDFEWYMIDGGPGPDEQHKMLADIFRKAAEQ